MLFLLPPRVFAYFIGFVLLTMVPVSTGLPWPARLIYLAIAVFIFRHTPPVRWLGLAMRWLWWRIQERRGIRLYFNEE